VIAMWAFLAAWCFASSVWTLFCIFDKFRTWIYFRRWKATVFQCHRESVVLLSFLVREIRDANERMRGGSCPCNVGPKLDESDAQNSNRSNDNGSPPTT
jgi:hypothetical protein